MSEGSLNVCCCSNYWLPYQLFQVVNLRYALDRIIGGQAKVTNTVSKQERKVVAYHECGHVLVSWMLEHTDALLKVWLQPQIQVYKIMMTLLLHAQYFKNY